MRIQGAPIALRQSGWQVVAALRCPAPTIGGTIQRGGAHGWGTVFRFDLASETISVSRSFDPAVDGENPSGALIAYNGPPLRHHKRRGAHCAPGSVRTLALHMWNY